MAKVYPVSIVKHKPVTASNPSALTHTMLFFLSITTGQHHPPCNKMERQRRRKRKGEKQREREGGTGRGKTKHGPNYPINEQLSLCSLIACAAFFLVLMVLAKRERGRERDLLNAQDCSCGVMREVTINRGGRGSLGGTSSPAKESLDWTAGEQKSIGPSGGLPSPAHTQHPLRDITSCSRVRLRPLHYTTLHKLNSYRATYTGIKITRAPTSVM